jgi:ribA/ribD-fused uncharacterized protein
MITTIEKFDGEYKFLSNYYDSPIEYEGLKYPTVEHAFQAAKSTDPVVREMIATAATPGNAKSFGKKINLRPDWDKIKQSVMLELLLYKFMSSLTLRQKLHNTGEAFLIECDECSWMVSQFNVLGTLLMAVRTLIRLELI